MGDDERDDDLTLAECLEQLDAGYGADGRYVVRALRLLAEAVERLERARRALCEGT